MKREENRDKIDKTAYWRPTDDPDSWSDVKKSWLLEEAERLRSHRMLTCLGAGSSSIMCACEFISGLWGGALSRRLCMCYHVEGTCLGTDSEWNPRNMET